jgi:hypothetical protein
VGVAATRLIALDRVPARGPTQAMDETGSPALVLALASGMGPQCSSIISGFWHHMIGDAVSG